MESELTHLEIEELLGAFALDAVEPAESEAVEAHLIECPRCRAEVTSHREVAAFLALAGSPAPQGLWQRIADSLEEPPPELALARVVPISAGRRRLLPARPVGAVAAVAASVIGLLGTQLYRQDERIDRLSPAIEQRGLDEAASAALFDTRSRKVELRSDDGALFAKAVVAPGGGGYLVRHNLPPLPEDLTYQLWGVVDDRTVSLGVLGSDPKVKAFSSDDEVSLLAVTAEQAGGVASTAKPPIVRGVV